MFIRYLSSTISQQIDKELMSSNGGFSIDQLMELAGFSCAEAVYRSYPPLQGHRRVLIACGPGNQGGDGLVAARHLKHFGYHPLVWYPKPKETPLFQGLHQQLKNLNVEFVTHDNFTLETLNASDIVLDAVFGFSFKGEPREPFKSALENMISAQQGDRPVPIISVDIPSSWNVDLGPDTSDIARKFMPNSLVSLTAPKLGSRFFNGQHWLGGRFVDPVLDAKFDLRLPAYPGVSQIVDITEARPLYQ